MRANLAGLSSATTGDMIVTYDQLGGTGIVRNKALTIPGHINGSEGGPWASIEYVSIDPIHNGMCSSVGQHTQTTDELYYIVEGTGVLSANGVREKVTPGYLALAPRGTTHSIRNESSAEALSFLVVELHALSAMSMPPVTLHFPSNLQRSETFAPVRIRQERIQCMAATLDLRDFFGPRSAWGKLSLVQLPPSTYIDAYADEQADQLLFLSGFVSLMVMKSGHTASQAEKNEEISIDTSGEGYHSVFIPRGASCQIKNRASGNYPATILRLMVPRQ